MDLVGWRVRYRRKINDRIERKMVEKPKNNFLIGSTFSKLKLYSFSSQCFGDLTSIGDIKNIRKREPKKEV